MANDLNQCNFIGRLGADPEMRYLPSGDPVANFRIAVGWKTKEKEGAEWLSIVAFGKLAEIVGTYCRKGVQVFVSCRAKTEEYEKNGEKRYATKFVADKMQLLGGKPEGADNHAPERKPEPKPASGGALDDVDDQIPF